MPHFIHRENIKHFQSLLETTTDENKRQIILKLLAEEKAKEAAIGQPSGKRGAGLLVSPDRRYAT